MRIKRFNESIQKVNESKTLYRLVRVPNGEPLVVDIESPGKFYFQNIKDIDESLLKGEKGDLHVIKVTTDDNNIDDNASEASTGANVTKVIVLKDPSKAEVQSIEPYKKG